MTHANYQAQTIRGHIIRTTYFSLGHMAVAHPMLLLVAVFVAIWPVLRLGRFFFGTFSDFVNDMGFGSPHDTVVSGLWIALGVYPFNIERFFHVLGFIVSSAAVVAASYHVLLLVTGNLLT